MTEYLRVRVLRADSKVWYARKVGVEFDVYRDPAKPMYLLKQDVDPNNVTDEAFKVIRVISEDDCEVVPPITVRVTKASGPRFWYARHIGEEFLVYRALKPEHWHEDYADENYRVINEHQGTGRLIDMADCVVVTVLRVRITRVGSPGYWYRGKVGEEFTVYEDPNPNPRFKPSYILKEDYDNRYDARYGDGTQRHINKVDCEVITEEEDKTDGKTHQG